MTETVTGHDTVPQPASGWLRVVLGLVALLLTLLVAGRLFRSELEAVGTWFVTAFGLWGIALGVFLADAMHFPVPAQFYMLLSIVGGNSDLQAIATLYASSVAGGIVGYNIGRRLTRIAWFRQWLDRAGGRIAEFVRGPHACRGAFFISLSPFAYSVLCMACGLYHLRPRAFLIVLALRLPKIVAYYELIRLGWG